MELTPQRLKSKRRRSYGKTPRTITLDAFTSLLDNIPCSQQSSPRSAVTRGAVATGRRFSLMAVSVLVVGLMLGGCGPALTRPPVTEQDLLKLRTRGDEQSVAASRKLLGKLLERTKAEYDRRAAARQPPPVIDILIISGGGDWGAFGAGFLKGWRKISAQHPLAKPEFDAVTGVSTGTLIAPFAFLGDQQSADEIVNLYRNPEPDWVKQRGFLYFLPDNISFAEVPGLEREMQKHITMLNSLENDPWLRTRFQYWFFYYDTGNPITYSADVLRTSLRYIVEQLDPDGTDPALRQMVVIGHSQGGLLAKMTAIDSGTRLWDTVSQRPLDELSLRDETREQLRRTLFLQPLPFVRQVVFIATPHRGSYEAGSWIAHQVAGFACLPKGFVDVMKDLVTGNPGVVTLSLGGLPRSINDMTPGNSFVRALASTPVAPGIATHSIVAVSGDKPLAEDDDGIVKYESAHLDDVESEVVIRSWHSVQGHPLAIAEVRRILYRHGEDACRSAGVCGATDNR